MNSGRKKIQTCFTLFLCFFSCSMLCGQSTLNWLNKGQWLPVYEVRGNFPYCFTGDGLVKGHSKDLTLLSSEQFGEGFLEVEIIENRRRGVVSNNGALRFTSDKGMFEFAAKVTAQEDIENAYFVMRFDGLGDPSFICRPIGDLKAGKTKMVSMLTQLKYEMPEQAHFFSGMNEIRTNLVPSSYRYERGDFLLASK